MPTVRLFAQAREVAGTGHDQFDGTTVDEVLTAAVGRYGPSFDALLANCQVWCNGEPVDRASAVGPDDEVAVLPPVSGGAT